MLTYADVCWHTYADYALLYLGAALMVLARTLIVSSRGLWGARALFLWQTEAVIRAPIRFFDSTPVGRILNRATEDQNSVDTQLCFAFGSLLAQRCVVVFFVAGRCSCRGAFVQVKKVN